VGVGVGWGRVGGGWGVWGVFGTALHASPACPLAVWRSSSSTSWIGFVSLRGLEYSDPRTQAYLSTHACTVARTHTQTHTHGTFMPAQVAGASVAELMATFCDNLLRKVSKHTHPCPPHHPSPLPPTPSAHPPPPPPQGGAEKLSDEDLESSLDRLVRLLAYVSEKDLFSEFYRKKLSRRWVRGWAGGQRPRQRDILHEGELGSRPK
jgi:hypothetical protein